MAVLLIYVPDNIPKAERQRFLEEAVHDGNYVDCEDPQDDTQLALVQATVDRLNEVLNEKG